MQICPILSNKDEVTSPFESAIVPRQKLVLKVMFLDVLVEGHSTNNA